MQQYSSSMENSLRPPRIYFRPDIPLYKPENRRWQGIPAIECTNNGTLYAGYYSGNQGEMSDNFVIISRSFDDGKTWKENEIIIHHEDPVCRCWTPGLWLDPLGRLWITWAQSWTKFDGRQGVWAIVIVNPDAEQLVWSEPRRIAHGVMLNKPIACQNGDWLFPCGIWSPEWEHASVLHPELSHEYGANLYVSKDQGKTFEYLSGVTHMPGRAFWEHMVTELKDGGLWMTIRLTNGIGEAYSWDHGLSWTDGQFSGISGPNSRFFVRRLKSGRLLMVNHSNWRYPQGDWKGYKTRNNLMAQLSEDDGKSWFGGLLLDVRNDVSYPDGCQEENGQIHIIYDYDRHGAREILTASFTEHDILEGRFDSPNSYYRRLVSKATGPKTDSVKG